MPASIAHIYRYPVKSLSAETLPEVMLTVGQALPNDRRFAIAHGASRYDSANPQWQPKAAFLALVRNARLAKLTSRYDDATDVLVIERDGKPVCRGKLTDPIGRSVIEQFLAAFMGEEARGTPRIAVADGVAFTNVVEPYVSLIGMASLHDLERVVRAPVAPARFRANFYVEGLAPWAEFGWLGKTITLGAATLEVARRVGRCAAIEVNPATGARDLRILGALQSGFSHTDMGVYARVIGSGRVKLGDEISG